jgi:hypothetical protein
MNQLSGNGSNFVEMMKNYFGTGNESWRLTPTEHELLRDLGQIWQNRTNLTTSEKVEIETLSKTL